MVILHRTATAFYAAVLDTVYKKIKTGRLFLLPFLLAAVVDQETSAQNCADVTGPDRLIRGATNTTYSAVSVCDKSTYVWSVVNDATSTAAIVGSNRGVTVIVNPGITAGTFTVFVKATSINKNDLGKVAEGSRSTAVRDVTVRPKRSQ